MTALSDDDLLHTLRSIVGLGDNDLGECSCGMPVAKGRTECDACFYERRVAEHADNENDEVSNDAE